MTNEKQTITSADLIVVANAQLPEHEDFIEGVKVESVAEQHGVITFKGESFLDGNGLPTAKSMIAFNLYKWLCHHLSSKYTLVD
ncbi:hypothetical protein CW745_03315 [Psychromonas sp. psych-6C06]|uniref:DUF2498 family protein n=1 Tax=Psychromonas sp. psych-6C06 TaxID=2058089 RepID=UPI000C3371D2|nr:DUF2498 family protein [Psychromonas sp. psych-6C06]PKF62475.1 hypothetical protein CW745_03315 [Psychromonas sp. psych-6C06]